MTVPPKDRLRSLLWECMVTHSIRPGFADGFLLPYHEALDKCDEGRAFDPATLWPSPQTSVSPSFRSLPSMWVTMPPSVSLLSIRDAITDARNCSVILATSKRNGLTENLVVFGRSEDRFRDSAQFSRRTAWLWAISWPKHCSIRLGRMRIPGRLGSKLRTTLPLNFPKNLLGK